MKYRMLIAVCGVCLLIFFAFLLLNIFQQTEGSRVRVGDKTFSVDIADTEADRECGLGGRDSLCETCGMLFLFDRPDQYAFWMKDMQFPLDILWIRNGKIIHIEQNVDFHDQQRVYRPGKSADSVLELNAGSCRKWNIREGDSLSFEKK